MSSSRLSSVLAALGFGARLGMDLSDLAPKVTKKDARLRRHARGPVENRRRYCQRMQVKANKRKSLRLLGASWAKETSPAGFNPFKLTTQERRATRKGFRKW